MPTSRGKLLEKIRCCELVLRQIIFRFAYLSCCCYAKLRGERKLAYAKSIVSILVITFLLGAPLQSLAAFNPEINYQAKLTDSAGDAVTDASYSIVFSLYTASSGGTAIWTETRSVSTTDGLFSVMLGNVSSLAAVDFNQTLYLGVKVGGDSEMTPRKKLGAVPAAFEASQLSGAVVSDFLSATTTNATATITALTVTNSTTTNATTTSLYVGSNATVAGALIVSGTATSTFNGNISLAGTSATLTIGSNTAENNYLKFNYSPTGGGDVTGQLEGVDQMSYGFNNRGYYGGTSGVASGRTLYVLDRVTGLNRAGFNASGDFYVGPSNTNYGLSVKAPNTGVTGLTVLSNGYVGIGTSTPDTDLSIFASTGTTTLKIHNSGTDLNAVLQFMEDTVGQGMELLYDANGNDLTIQGITEKTPIFTVERTGRVGIGKANPSTELDIVGTASSTGLQINGNGTITGSLTLGTALGVASGGTGLTSTPTYGQVLLGNGSGGYSLVATSTLGLGGSGGTVSSVDASGGTTGFSFGGGPITTSGTLTLSGTLVAGNGGTGLSSVTANQILIGNAGGTGWTQVATSSLGVAISDTTGTLAVARGGTGLTSYTLGDVLYASGTGTLAGTSTANLKTSLALNNVENTALSTWAGTTNITTLGTITSGTWSGTEIGVAKGGTGLTATPSYGQMLVGNGTGYTLSATSTLGIALSDTVGTLSVAKGGTGATTFGQGWLYSDGGTGALSASTSPTVNYLTATSTTATSTFAGGFAVETSGLVYDYSTNNVGIGTEAPLYPLHIKMDRPSNAPMFVVEETNGNDASIGFISQIAENWIMGPDRSDNRSFKIGTGISDIGTATKFTITSGGNVGIGDSTPDYTLDVTGNARFTSLVDAAHFVATSTTATSTFAGGFAVETSGLVYDYSTNRVGIGTASPSQELEVISSASNGNVFVVSDSAGTDTSIFRIFEVSGGGGLASLYSAADAEAIRLSATGDSWINTGNNFGVGTTSPLSLLSVGTAGNAFRVDTTGAVKEGIWNGTAIGVAYGGTGLTSTPSYGQMLVGNGTGYTLTATSSLNIALSDTVGTLSVAKGGTNATSQSTNGVNYFDGTSITSGSNLTYTASTLSVLNTAGDATMNVDAADADDAIFQLLAGTGEYTQIIHDGNANISYFRNRTTDGDMYLGVTDTTLGLHYPVRIYNNSLVFNDAGLDYDMRFEGDTDANLLYLDAGSSNIGIGSSSPLYKLSVEGSSSLGNEAQAGYFTATSTSATSTFAGGLAIEASGLVYDYTTNYVGIGTASPGSNLEIARTDGSSAFTLSRSGTSVFTVGANAFNTNFSSTNDFRFSAGTASDAVIIQDNTGYLGVGTTTPTGKLQVVYSTANTANGFKVAPSSASNRTLVIDGNQLDVIYSNTQGVGTTAHMLIQSSSGAGFTGVGSSTPFAKLAVENTGTDWSFAVNDVANDSTPFIIDASGVVGIGTTTPMTSYELAVQGDGLFSGVAVALSSIGAGVNDSSTGVIFAYGAGASSNEGGQIDIYNAADYDTTFEKWSIDGYQDDLRIFSSDAGAVHRFLAGGGLQLDGSLSNTDSSFNIGPSGNADLLQLAATQLVVDGSVGINDTTPTYSLDVTGNARFTSLVDAAHFVATSTTATSTFAGGLAIETSGLVYDYSTNFVGINTATPHGNLEVDGSIYLSRENRGIFFNNYYNGSSYTTINTGESGVLNFGTSGELAYSASASRSAGGTGLHTQLFTVLNTGNFGIGSSTPTYKLSVEGTSSLGNEARAGYFTATSTSATSTFAGGLAVETSGLVYDYSTNYVGVGIANPTYQLHVNGTGGLAISGNTSGGTFLIRDSILETDRSDGMYVMYGNNAKNINFQNGKVVFNGGGGVGIATTTPNNKLDIYSTTKAAIGFSGASGSTYKWTMGMDVSNAGRFVIASSTALGTNNRFVIDGSGNVGIGTTTPGSLLSIGNTGTGPINLSDTATSTFGFGINLKGGCFAIGGTCLSTGGSGTPAGTNGNIQFNNSGSFGGESDLNWDSLSDTLDVASSTGDGVLFAGYINGSGDDLFSNREAITTYISKGKGVLLNGQTASAGGSVYIAPGGDDLAPGGSNGGAGGTVYLAVGGSGDSYGANGTVNVGDTNSSGGTLNLYADTLFKDSFSNVGSTNVCWDGTGGSNIGSCTSLRQYKDNIQDIDMGLEEVMALRPRTFNWKDGMGPSDDLGFIADEVEAVDSRLATYNEGVLNGVKYSQMSALLVKAIQEQQVQILDLKKQLASSTTPLLAGNVIAGDISGMWTLDEFGHIKALSILDLGEYAIQNVRSLSSFTGKWSIDENGKLIADEIETNKLTVKNGITTQDKTTGEFYCIYIDNGSLQTEAGSCEDLATEEEVEAPPVDDGAGNGGEEGGTENLGDTGNTEGSDTGGEGGVTSGAGEAESGTGTTDSTPTGEQAGGGGEAPPTGGTETEPNPSDFGSGSENSAEPSPET